jgi:hypothetical protein
MSGVHRRGGELDAIHGPCKCGKALEVDQQGPFCPDCMQWPTECTCPPAKRADQLRQALLSSETLDQLPEPEPLIDGVLFRDSLAWLHGKPGHGKSFIALDWAACVAAGLPWQGHGTMQGLVLYVVAEGAAGLRQRVRAWEDHAHQRMDVQFLPIAVQLLAYADVSAVVEVAEDLNPAFVILDTQARVTVGADENSAKDMGELVAAIDRIRQACRACVLLVHHEARAGENMRGSTALEGAADTLIRVTKDGPYLRIENPKQKHIAEFDDIRLKLAPRLDSAVCTAVDVMTEDLSESEQKIIDALRDAFGDAGAPSTKLRGVAQLPDTTFYRTLTKLVAKGTVANVGTKKRPHYVLPEFIKEIGIADLVERCRAAPDGKAPVKDSLPTILEATGTYDPVTPTASTNAHGGDSA